MAHGFPFGVAFISIEAEIVIDLSFHLIFLMFLILCLWREIVLDVHFTFFAVIDNNPFKSKVSVCDQFFEVTFVVVFLFLLA